MHNKLFILSITYFTFLFLFTFTMTHAFFNDSAQSGTNTFTAAAVFPTPAGLSNHLVISEVQIGASDSTQHDFVEIYNPTSSSIDLDGLRLVHRTRTATSSAQMKSWTTSTIIPAHKYYLWASTDDGYAASISADTSTGDNLANNGSLALIQGNKDTGTLIDAVAWGSNHVSPLFIETTSFTTNPTAGQSIERKALSTSTSTTMNIGGTDLLKGNGLDMNNNSTDFILRNVSQPQNSSSPAENL